MSLTGAGPSVTWDGLDHLGLVGRLLVTCDGTVTTMLEQIANERITTCQLAQSPVTGDTEGVALLGAAPGGSLTERTTRLVGSASGTVYARAKSIIAVDAMPPLLRVDLFQTDEPLGRLLRRHRIESYREILHWQVHGPGSGQPLRPEASRSYRVFTGGRPVLLIQEHFTSACFRTDAGRPD